eukprot:scaffold610532_cov19-Prasinocladus_malaysianus.AAC.1
MAVSDNRGHMHSHQCPLSQHSRAKSNKKKTRMTTITKLQDDGATSRRRSTAMRSLATLQSG